MPSWVKPGVWGAVIGSILIIIIIGFNWGGWMLGSTADQMAMKRADASVTAVLIPVCLAQSEADAARVKKLGELKAITLSYEQYEFVMQTGWATIPGSESPNREVAEACTSALLNTAAK